MYLFKAVLDQGEDYKVQYASIEASTNTELL